MSEWTAHLAATLNVTPPTSAGEEALLHVSRDVAHRVERKDTPVSAYLMGVAAGLRIAGGADPGAALDEVVTLVTGALPPAPTLGP